jgi:membrane fusion protein, multidrug efflux system
MRPGQPAEISVDAYPNLPLRGTVESFAPGTGAQFALLPPENATGNFTKIVQRVPVRIRLAAPENAAPAFVPGLSIEVSVNTKQAASVHTAGDAQ